MDTAIASRKATIFVVDDDADTVAAMTEILEDFGGYNVRVGRSGKFALESIQKFPPDLILLDIQLDDMNGEEVYHVLKQNPETCKIPIIFVTGFDNPANVCKLWNPLVMDYIAKPFDMNYLLMKINKVLTIVN